MFIHLGYVKSLEIYTCGYARNFDELPYRIYASQKAFDPYSHERVITFGMASLVSSRFTSLLGSAIIPFDKSNLPRQARTASYFA